MNCYVVSAIAFVLHLVAAASLIVLDVFRLTKVKDLIISYANMQDVRNGVHLLFVIGICCFIIGRRRMTEKQNKRLRIVAIAAIVLLLSTRLVHRFFI